MKIKALEGHPKKVQLLHGVSFKNDDTVIYDDSTVLNFDHPSDSSLAAVMAHDELSEEITDAAVIKNLQSLSLPELTQEQRAQMDVNDLDLYERKTEEF